MSAAARTTLPPTTAPRSTTTAAPRPTTTVQGYTFHERDYTFAPATFNVAAGTRVTIVNDGPSTHTWTADNGGWDSGYLAPGTTYAFTFATPGTFSFKCVIHPVMQGSVTVT
jgi:plastocyanin